MKTPATILLAEDDDDDAMIMDRAFRKAGITNPVARVRDGEEAIQYLSGQGIYADREKHPVPVLLLLDLKMPGRDGFEVLAWVKKNPDLKRLPVTVLTSSDHNSDIARAYEIGANSYLRKPTEFLDLVQILKALQSYWLIVEKSPSEAGA